MINRLDSSDFQNRSVPKSAAHVEENSVVFSAVLKDSAQKMGQLIQGAEEAQKQRFKDKKREVARVSIADTDEPKEESLRTTVFKLAKALKSLAQFERRNAGL